MHLLTIIVIALAVSIIKQFTEEFVEYSKERTQLIAKNIQIKEIKTFNFLLNSGKKRLLSNNIQGAYSEFKLAYNIQPEHKELNQLLIETLSILCTKDSLYCKELDKLLKKSL